jgi:hypothetical protein
MTLLRKRCRSKVGSFFFHWWYVDNKTGSKFCIRCNRRRRE